MSAENKIKELGLILPPPWNDKYNRLRAVRSGNHVYMSGHGPLGPDSEPLVVGKLGRELTTEQGAAAARLAGLAVLATLRNPRIANRFTPKGKVFRDQFGKVFCRTM